MASLKALNSFWADFYHLPFIAGHIVTAGISSLFWSGLIVRIVAVINACAIRAVSVTGLPLPESDS